MVVLGVVLVVLKKDLEEELEVQKDLEEELGVPISLSRGGSKKDLEDLEVLEVDLNYCNVLAGFWLFSSSGRYLGRCGRSGR